MVEVPKDSKDYHSKNIRHCLDGLVEIRTLERDHHVNISSLEQDLTERLGQELHTTAFQKPVIEDK